MTEPDLDFTEILKMSKEKQLAMADHFDAMARKATLAAVEYTEGAKVMREMAAS